MTRVRPVRGGGDVAMNAEELQIIEDCRRRRQEGYMNMGGSMKVESVWQAGPGGSGIAM